jgi:hypothetical protein
MIRSSHRFVALILALVWGPATMCCALEAAGWNILCKGGAGHDCTPDSTKNDGCNGVGVENGKYQNSVPSIKVALPVTELCSCLICLRTFEPEPESQQAAVVREIAQLRDWVPIWQFERRAAAPAHAPDSLSA